MRIRNLSNDTLRMSLNASMMFLTVSKTFACKVEDPSARNRVFQILELAVTDSEEATQSHFYHLINRSDCPAYWKA